MKTPFFDGKLVHSRRVIYTPSPFARSNLIHLQEVGSLQARQPHTSTRKGLASYLFFWVESGSGELEYEGAWHELFIESDDKRQPALTATVDFFARF